MALVKLARYNYHLTKTSAKKDEVMAREVAFDSLTPLQAKHVFAFINTCVASSRLGMAGDS